MRQFKLCPTCQQSYTGTSHCSKACETGSGIINALGTKIKSHQTDSDRRLYFYDLPFGDLVDLYMIYLLRRLHSEDLQGRREADFAVDKLERSLITKINRYNFDAHTREDIDKLLKLLWSANATLWRLRSRAHNNKYPMEEQKEAAWSYLNGASGDRDKARLQLNWIVDGRANTTCNRIYA